MKINSKIAKENVLCYNDIERAVRFMGHLIGYNVITE